MARPGCTKPPGSGRKRGSIDREARQMLSGKMAKAIYDTYVKLGPDWLLKIAQDKPELFCSVFLQRLLPPALKDPNEDSPLVNVNIGSDPIEAARRVAFALAMGLDAMGTDPTADRVPYVQLDPDPSPQELMRQDLPPDPEHERWAQQVALTPEEKLNQETLDERCSRVASAPQRPAWMPKQERPFVGIPRSKRDDLL